MGILPRATSTWKPRRRSPGRTFYLTVALLLIFGVVTTFLSPSTPPLSENAQLGKRWVSELESLDGGPAGVLKEAKCRHVHRAKDQCAFVRSHCADHEIGVFSYLRLYFCKLPRAKPVAFILLAVWLALLFSTIGIAASDFLCVNLSTLASVLGMSENLTGVTFLAFGNGSPDVFSTFAAMSSNSGSLAIGELIGAAGFISAVVAGSMALVRPFKVARRSFVRDVLFFICAATFSLVFIADGQLHTWECATMILFYIFYVIVVVSWHWYLGRQRRKRERDLMARAHFHIPQNQELEIEEESDEDNVVGPQRPPVLGASTEDFDELEQAGIPAWKIEVDEEDDETRGRYLAELQGNMRLGVPRPGHQRIPSMGPIRPSLVGALEFRSVLSSLQKSRNVQSGRIHLRSYSDDPNHPGLHPNARGVLDRGGESSGSRPRALSANPEVRTYLASTHPRDGIPPALGDARLQSQQPPAEGSPGLGAGSRTGVLFDSPSSSGYPSRSQSPCPPRRAGSPNLLAPPEGPFRQLNYQTDGAGERSPSLLSPQSKPDGRPASHHIRVASLSPPAPFPPYQDDSISVASGVPSIRLPSASLSAADDSHIESEPLKWWPYKFLPPPRVLITTLVPTLAGWENKSIWDRILGLTAAPSVFILTITLPVVEPYEPEHETKLATGSVSPLPDENRVPNTPSDQGNFGADESIPMLRGDVQDLASRLQDHRGRDFSSANRSRHDSEIPVLPTPLDRSNPTPKDWNRWLLIVQMITAPFLIALAAWTNFDSDMDPRNLVIPTLVSLLVSCLLLAMLLLTTNRSTEQIPMRARPFLAFFGFIVSIAWVSSLATEVVSLLKTFGVILSISDSLLGLTVFAVGNSLGDLVADVTVARLGYPVMALSACFGGPMLNILIGIGVGGLYMTLHSAPKSSSFLSTALAATGEPYHISVSRSLLISGATLLATLVGILIIVPLNGWRMDRKIGSGLVILWCVSTICNVIVELVT